MLETGFQSPEGSAELLIVIGMLTFNVLNALL